MLMCGSVCTNLANDPNNCGTCGHVCGCGSTTCTAGMCDAHVLADQQGDPVTLALNNGVLYWGTDIDRNVMAMPADGSVAAKALYPGRTAVRGFAFDAARVYFTRNVFNIVESGTLAGTSSGNFTNQQEPGAASIATDGSNVYWTDSGNGGAVRRAPNGAPVSTPSTVAGGQMGADGLALDATSVYWSTNDPVNGAIHSAPKNTTNGSGSLVVTKQASPHGVAVANGFIYWINQANGTPKAASINRVPVTGGAPAVLASQLSAPQTIAVNGDSVYWTDALDGTISRVPLAGGSPPQFVVAHEAAPAGLALSSTCLYFTDVADQTAGKGSVRAHDLR